MANITFLSIRRHIDAFYLDDKIVNHRNLRTFVATMFSKRTDYVALDSKV